MSGGYQISDQSKCYFLTLTVVFWIDVFSRSTYKKILIDCLDYCRRSKGLEIFAFVIMTNHLHLVVRAKNEDLSSVIRDFKSYSSKQILQEIENRMESRRDWMLILFRKAAKIHQRNSVYQFWTKDNHPVSLYSPKFIYQKINYIHQNPVRAGLVANAEEYLYSSAVNYSTGKGVIEIDEITYQLAGGQS